VNSLTRSVACAIAMTGLMAGWPAAAIAGGATLGDDEIQNLPSYFGFAKDDKGSVLADVRVSIKLKGIAVVAHTDALGSYKIPVIATDPDVTEIACTKDGFHQTGSVRRTPPGGDAKTPVEIACTLAPG
jgi:hypothetical protein